MITYLHSTPLHSQMGCSMAESAECGLSRDFEDLYASTCSAAISADSCAAAGGQGAHCVWAVAPATGAGTIGDEAAAICSAVFTFVAELGPELVTNPEAFCTIVRARTSAYAGNVVGKRV